MDWSSAPAGCTLTGTGTRADIHGSVVLKAGMTFNFAGDIWFVIDMNVTNTISSNGVHFPQSVIFNGNIGTLNIMNDFYVEKEVAHISGTINTNNHKITVGNNFNYNYYPNYIAMLNLGSSEFNVLQGQAYFGYIPENLNAGTSTVKHHSGGLVLGNTQYLNLPTLYKVKFNTASNSNPSILSALNVQDSLVFNYYGTLRSWSSFNALATINTAIFNDNGDILNDNNFLHLKLTTGKTYTFGDYTPINQVSNNSTDQTILAGGTFTANGGAGCTGAITIITNASGTPVNIINNSGSTINTYNVLQQDIHGSGTMPLINNNGNDLGNNTGWIFNSPLVPYDLYWIGGQGEWIDPNHWSLTDGGAPSGCVPNAITNVHFTALSGFVTSNTDSISTPFDYRTLSCRDLDFTTVTGYPTFHSVFNGNNYSVLNIYGSSRFGTEMYQGYFGKIYFKGNGNHKIESNGIPFRSNLVFDGNGTWSLVDSFTLYWNNIFYPSVHHVSGTIKTEGQSMNFRLNNSWYGNRMEFGNPGDAFGPLANRGAELWLGIPGGASSKIYNNGNHTFRMEYEANKFHSVESHIICGTINAGTANIMAPSQPHDFHDVTYVYSGAGFNGGITGKLKVGVAGVINNNSINNRLIRYAEFSNIGEIFGNHSFDTLVFTGGNRYIIEKNTTQTITTNGALLSMGGCDSLVYIQSSDGSATATIKKEAGSNLVIDNTIVENIVADLSTGVTYTINHGLTLASSSGWTVVNPTPRNLYWVGDGGFWDESVHWSLNTDGTGGGECPPTPLDNVFFNQHSFSSANQTVQIRQYDAYCRDMDWTGILFNPRFFASTYLIHFNIFGDYILDPNMTHDFYGEANFRADHPTSVTMAGHQFHFDVHFKNPLGDWTLTDNFKNQSIYGGQANLNLNGTIRTNGNVELFGSLITSETSKLYLGTSTITLSPNGNYPTRSVINTLEENFHSGTSHVIVKQGYFTNAIFCFKSIEFYDVTLQGTSPGVDPSLFQNASIKNKITVENYWELYSLLENDTMYINEIEFKNDGYLASNYTYLNGDIGIHKATFAPGKSYLFYGRIKMLPKNGQEAELNITGLPNQYIQLNGQPGSSIIMDDFNNTPTCTQYVFLSNMTHTGSEIIQVPTPGGNVINNSGWAFIPCNPCPNNPPILDTNLSNIVRCGSGTVDLVLLDLLPGENAVWFSDSLLTDTIYNSANLFQPLVSTGTCFWAKIFNEGGQCYSSDTIRVCIHVNELPLAFTVTGGGSVCSGGNLNIILADSEVGVDYQLKLDGVDFGAPIAGTGNQLIISVVFPQGVTSGVFTIIAVGDNGCTNTMSNSAAAMYLPTPAPLIGVTSNNPVCSLGGSIELFENGGEAVSWSWTGPGGWSSALQNPARTPVTPSETGWYSCTITALNGCTNTSYIYVEVLPSAVMDQPSNSVYCHNTSTNAVVFTGSDPDIVYHWTNNNTSIGLAANGNGNITTFIANNTTNFPVVATITVTPSLDSMGVTCYGAPINFTITINPIPTIGGLTDDVYCAGESTISLAFAGTVPGTTFTWTNDNTAIGLGSTGGNQIFPFIATNTTGSPIFGTIHVYPQYTNAGVTCTGVSDNFRITVNPAPMVNPITDVVLCSNQVLQAINFTGNLPGITYSWTNDNTIFGLASGGTGGIPITFLNAIGGVPAVSNIMVTPSLINGGLTCIGVPESFQIIINPLPIMGYYPDIVTCAGQSIGPVIFTSNVPGAVYAWTNNNTSIGLGAIGNGNISAFVGLNNTLVSRSGRIRVFPSFTNAGVTCAPELTSFLITVDPLPAPVIMITETSGVASNDGILCEGSTATLSASGGGSYVWSTGATTASITTGNAGTYTVTVTSQGCMGTATSSIVVNPLPVPMIMVTETSGVANNDGILCAGATTMLTAGGGGTYVWSTGASGASITVSPSGTTTYTVTVTNANNCSATASTTVTVNPLPLPAILLNETSGATNNDGIICAGGAVQLTASSGTGYMWSAGGFTTASIVVVPPMTNTFTVTVTNVHGCTAVTSTTITVRPLPDASIVITDGAGIISDNGIICAGLPATLSTQAGGMYMWSTGQTTSDINTMISGTYTVTVTSLGCTSTESVILEFNALPCGWYECNIGSGCDGDWTYDIPSEEFTGTSTNCYYANPYNHDELSFAARNLCGNGSITVEVKSITGNLAWAGITMRETNADNSKKIQLMTNLSLLSRREARYTTGGTSYFQQFPSQNRYWLRLVRTGNQYAGYVSPDGSYWYPVMAADINMNACLKVGMVVTNYNPISTSTAVFGNVVVTDGGNNRPVATDDLVVEKEEIGWKDLTVKPNPTTGQIELDMTSFKNNVKQLEIYNSQGKLVKTEWIDQNCEYLNLDLSAYVNGVYLIRLRSEGLPDVSKRMVLLK